MAHLASAVFVNHSTIAGSFLFSVYCMLWLTACTGSLQQRELYRNKGIAVGVETDLSTDEHASPPIINRHPAQFTPSELRILLDSLEVSGYSGTVLGMFMTPTPRPVFTDVEIAALLEPFATAFRKVTPRERVYFSLQNPAAPYDTDRTSGSLFLRDDYLHVLLTDHYAFLKADPGGGETRDPRDHKGMKLWVTAPAKAATVPGRKEPNWDSFEKVHISLKPSEVVAALAEPRGAPSGTSPVGATPPVADQSTGRSSDKAQPSGSKTADPGDDSRLQIKELTSANLDLRSRLKEQTAEIKELTSANLDLRSRLKEQTEEIEKLKDELERLRSEIKGTYSKPPSERKSPRKQSTQ